MNLRYLLLADAASRATDGKYIVHGLFDRIGAKAPVTSEMPYMLPSLGIAFNVHDVLMTKEMTLRFHLFHEGTKKAVIDQSVPMDVVDLSDRSLNGALTFQFVRLPAAGTYVLEFFLNGERAGQSSFELVAPTA